MDISDYVFKIFSTKIQNKFDENLKKSMFLIDRLVKVKFGFSRSDIDIGPDGK